MSNWLIKSESNFKATNKLNNESFYYSSVHCSYYSCVQLMYHLLSFYLKKTEHEISVESHAGSLAEKGLHIWLIKTVFNEFKNSTDANSFNSNINDLKTLRGKADYKNRIIKQREAEEARNKAYLTIELLKRNFNL